MFKSFFFLLLAGIRDGFGGNSDCIPRSEFGVGIGYWASNHSNQSTRMIKSKVMSIVSVTMSHDIECALASDNYDLVSSMKPSIFVVDGHIKNLH
jgi:hypothetical protein